MMFSRIPRAIASILGLVYWGTAEPEMHRSMEHTIAADFAFDQLLGGGQRRCLFPPHCGTSYPLRAAFGLSSNLRAL